jgi:hypothetical protein
MVFLHGLKKMRGRLQLFLPKREEVTQSAPDLQMVVGRGQIEKELWQGEVSGLGTLSPGPPPLPPLVDLLPLLALPLLGGRAVGFSRGSVAGSALRLLVGSRPPLGPNLWLLWTRAGVGVRPGAERGGLVRPAPVCFQGLLDPGIVAEQVSEGRGAKFQRGTDRLCRR